MIHSPVKEYEGIGMKNGFEELSNEMGHYNGELGKLNVKMRGED